MASSTDESSASLDLEEDESERLTPPSPEHRLLLARHPGWCGAGSWDLRVWESGVRRISGTVAVVTRGERESEYAANVAIDTPS